jgi:hypothetical protein
LDQNIEHDPDLVRGSPLPVFHTGDLEHDLVEMPFITDPWLATTDLGAAPRLGVGMRTGQRRGLGSP